MRRGPEAATRLRASRIPALRLCRRCSVGCVAGVLAAAPLVFLLAVSPVFLLAVHRCFGRRRARPPSAPPVFLRLCHRCSVGWALGVPLAGPPVFRWLRRWCSCWLRHRGCGLRRARPLTVCAVSFTRRVGSKPGQALRPRRHPPHWWRVVYVPSPGPSFPAIPSGLIWIGCAHVDRLCTSG